MKLRITGGSCRGQRINVPRTSLRPTEEKVRASLFNTLFSMIFFEDKRFLDLFAGSGAVGIEAMSRGFGEVSFADCNRKAISTVKENILSMGERFASDFYVLDSFAESALKKLKGPYDVIFIDPPYVEIEKIPTLVRSLIEENLLSDCGVIVVETGALFEYQIDGMRRKDKKYGNTFLTFYRRED